MIKKYLSSGLLLSTLLLTTEAFAVPKLIFAADLIRHGDRTPMIEVPKSPHYWPQGLGELTAEGMQQEYLLGQALRKKYIDHYHLLQPHYQAGTVYIRSTDENRALASAQAFILGFYPLGTGPMLAHSNKPALPFAYQPIPIHSVAKKTDFLLKANDNLGQTSPQQILKDWKSPIAISDTQLQQWQNASGFNLKNPHQFILFGDNLYVRRNHKIPMPNGISAEDASTIIAFSKAIFVHAFKNPMVAQTTGKAFLGDLLNYFKEAKAQSNSLKYVLYSAHDSSLLSVMTTLGAPLQNFLRYAADLNFLFFEDNHDYYVKIFLNNQPVHIPSCGGNTCTLDEFAALAKGDE